jgi:hypothetical protein
VENIRLIYEQIEHAKKLLKSGSVLDLRLSLILLDNAAEVMMYRKLMYRFRWDDKFNKWERIEELPPELRPRYTREERDRAEREFEPMIRLLVKFGDMKHREAAVLRVCHKIRVEAFHRAEWNENILLPTTTLLFLTVAGMTIPFRANWYTEPRADDSLAKDFLKRFGLTRTSALFDDGAVTAMREVLIQDIALDQTAFAELLAGELEERIESIISNLAYMGNVDADEHVDRNLQYGQFWQERGADIAKACLDRGEAWDPAVEQAFIEWKVKPGAKYTIPKLRNWQRHAAALRSSKTASNALERYWAIQDKFICLEDDVRQAVFEFDMEHG